MSRWIPVAAGDEDPNAWSKGELVRLIRRLERDINDLEHRLTRHEAFLHAQARAPEADPTWNNLAFLLAKQRKAHADAVAALRERAASIL